MKKLAALFLSIAVLTLCSACDNQHVDNSSNIDNTSNTDDSSKPDLNFGDPIDKHENPITYYTKEEVKEMIEKNGNLKVNDGYFYALVPKTVDHLSEFVTGTSYQLHGEEEIEEFKTVFKYLFPDHEFDERCFYYYYPYDEFDDSVPIEEQIDQGIYGRPLNDSDVFNSYMAGDYIHNGLTCCIYSEEKFPREESVSLWFRSPFGNDYCVFNKGVLQKYDAERKGKTTYYASDLISVREYESVGRFTPDSEENFKLLDDKEISIKDAVKFFEDYIVSIPTAAKHSGYNIHVNEVNVYLLPDNEHYIFEFINSREFDNIPFSFAWDGTDVDGENRDLSEGYMVVTDDVEAVYAPYNARLAFDEKRYTEFIPFEEAVKTISEKLTDYVDFKVYRAELLYRVNETIYWGQIGENFERARPAWKLTLENPNDDVTYVAYLDAITGEFNGGR